MLDTIRDEVYRVVDLVGHCTFALLLPGKWYWQFAPDSIFVICMLISWIKTDRITPPEISLKGTVLLRLHRFSHTIYFPVLMLMFGWKPALQSLVHVIWDQWTHQEIWQRRSLFTF
jgi:hypothetical protein